jgi:hypothetical protein
LSDGISNLVGGRTISRKFGDRTFHFSVVVLAEHAEKEQYILSLKPTVYELLSQIPSTAGARTRQALEDAAFRSATKPQCVTRDDESEFDQSLHGLAWGLWRALRDNHKEFGRMTSGADAVYTSPAGRPYSITPAEGVQRALDFIEQNGNERFGELVDIRDGVEQKSEMGNSSGSENSPSRTT